MVLPISAQLAQLKQAAAVDRACSAIENVIPPPPFRLKRTLAPESVTAVVDTREQRPLDLSPLQSQPGTLVTGDYSVLGLEAHISVERKSLSDLLGCIGKERERFDKEIKRMLAYPVRALVVESTWADIEAGMWALQGRSRVHPNAVLGSLLGWIAYGVPVIMCGSHEKAGLYVSRLLYTAARRRWEELYAMHAAIEKA